ncbi:hypothetical protein CIP107536_00210 [Corynebacterium diphtheriae]|nr:hypothetical protein CIP107536_00210 [Corynebacterium diphtheriae]
MKHIDAAICRRKTEGKTAEPNYWDSQGPREATVAMLERHKIARKKCMTCTLLAECEKMLSDFEKEELRVDGVVAGRYCDVSHRNGPSIDVLRHCKHCNVRLIPQGGPRGKEPSGARKHRGEGLCAVCYPLFSRKQR